MKFYLLFLFQLLNIKLIICDLFLNTNNNNATKQPTTQSPKLLYFMSNDNKKIYTINEKSTFTNELNKGWIFDADKNINILLYVLINKNINLNSFNLTSSYVFFTTNENQCFKNSTQITSDLFKIDFSKHSKKFSLTSLNLTNGLNEAYLLIGEINVKLAHTSSKYYTCLNFNYDANQTEFAHQGTDNLWTAIITTKELLPFYLVIIIYLLLLSLSALFSGLNLGLMSLDLAELKVLMKCGTKKEKFYAKKIYPLRKRGNFLLCTILLGNVLVNSTSTLILGSYLDGLFAALGSTLFIVIFGEIIPQAACSRYGLAVGTYTRYITIMFMILTSPLSFPLSLVLDRVLGKEIAATYSRDKVRELMKQANLEENQKKFISGALDFKNKSVADVMMPIKDVFKLDINSYLGFETFHEIAEHGYSRIPLYEHTEENLIGIILMQDLLVNDPADKLPLRSVYDYFKHKVAKCTVDDKLDRMFEKFRQGESHMAFVYATDSDKNEENREAVGIVTLEDVIEELVQSEILDEADCKRENKKRRAKEAIRGKLKPSTRNTDNWNIFVNQEDTTFKPLISPQIRKALFQFLSTNVKPFTFDFINPKLLENVLKNPDFTKEKLNIADTDDNTYLYKLGEPCDYFIIILDGNATMKIGKDQISVQAGLFSYYGINALISDPQNQNTIQDILGAEHQYKPYIPEFSLKVNQRCVYFQMTRENWLKLIKTSIMERKYSVIGATTSNTA